MFDVFFFRLCVLGYNGSTSSCSHFIMLSAGLGYGAPGSGTTPPYSPPPPRHSPLPSFGFTQEQVACVCEVRVELSTALIIFVNIRKMRTTYLCHPLNCTITFTDILKRVVKKGQLRIVFDIKTNH